MSRRSCFIRIKVIGSVNAEQGEWCGTLGPPGTNRTENTNKAKENQTTERKEDKTGPPQQQRACFQYNIYRADYSDNGNYFTITICRTATAPSPDCNRAV